MNRPDETRFVNSCVSSRDVGADSSLSPSDVNKVVMVTEGILNDIRENERDGDGSGSTKKGELGSCCSVNSVGLMEDFLDFLKEEEEEEDEGAEREEEDGEGSVGSHPEEDTDEDEAMMDESVIDCIDLEPIPESFPRPVKSISKPEERAAAVENRGGGSVVTVDPTKGKFEFIGPSPSPLMPLPSCAAPAEFVKFLNRSIGTSKSSSATGSLSDTPSLSFQAAPRKVASSLPATQAGAPDSGGLFSSQLGTSFFESMKRSHESALLALTGGVAQCDQEKEQHRAKRRCTAPPNMTITALNVPAQPNNEGPETSSDPMEGSKTDEDINRGGGKRGYQRRSSTGSERPRKAPRGPKPIRHIRRRHSSLQRLYPILPHQAAPAVPQAQAPPPSPPKQAAQQYRQQGQQHQHRPLQLQQPMQRVITHKALVSLANFLKGKRSTLTSELEQSRRVLSVGYGGGPVLGPPFARVVGKAMCSR